MRAVAVLGGWVNSEKLSISERFRGSFLYVCTQFYRLGEKTQFY